MVLIVSYTCIIYFFRMIKLLKPAKEKKYTDLVISFLPSNGDEIDTEDLPAPPIRYFFNL